MATKKKQVSFRLDQTVCKGLRRYAKKLGVTQTKVVEASLATFIKK